MEHSILPPSSAARRVACPGSRALEAQYPQEEDAVAREGNAAHWVAAQLLSAILYSNSIVNFKIGEQAPNGELITEEMIAGASLYTDDVNSVFPHLKILAVEERVDISLIHTNCWGTPDAFGYSPKQDTIYIWDYKFGHRYVEVFENYQLIEYAAGVLKALTLTAIFNVNRSTKICFRIVQPRSYHRGGAIREWKTTVAGLEQYFKILQRTENLASQDVAACNPSPECRDCSARYVCPALQQAALNILDHAKDNIPLELPNDALANELRRLQYAAKLLDARITGLEQQALSLIKNGERVPYFTVEEGIKRDRWIKSLDEIKQLGNIYNVDLLKPQEAITPNQAVSAGVPKDVIKNYSERPRGELKLVPENIKIVSKIFKGDK